MAAVQATARNAGRPPTLASCRSPRHARLTAATALARRVAGPVSSGSSSDSAVARACSSVPSPRIKPMCTQNASAWLRSPATASWSAFGDRAARIVQGCGHVTGHADGQGQQQQGLQAQRRDVAGLGDGLREHVDGLGQAVAVAVDRAAQHQRDRAQCAGLQVVNDRLQTLVGLVERARAEMLFGGAQAPQRVVAAEVDGEVDQFGGRAGGPRAAAVSAAWSMACNVGLSALTAARAR